MKGLRSLIVVLMLLVAVVCFGCGGKDDTIKVGILQTATHSALDDARDGFKEKIGDELDGKKVEFVVRNPEGDSQTMNTYATDLAAAFQDDSQKLPIKVNFYLQKNKETLLTMAQDIEKARVNSVKTIFQ